MIQRRQGFVQLYIAAAIAAVALGGWLGYRWMEARLLKAEAEGKAWKASALGEREARVRQAEGYKYVDRYIDRVQVIEGEVREIIKEIPVEIACTTKPDGTAYLSSDWRVLHDAAVSLANGAPRVPDAARATAEGVTPRTAVETVVENYATCAKNAKQLDELSAWAKSQTKKAPE